MLELLQSDVSDQTSASGDHAAPFSSPDVGHNVSLTQRQLDVLNCLRQGKSNKQIAYELGATERTIKAHRQRVMQKMQVQSLAELVSLAERVGILREAGGNIRQQN